MSHAEERRVRLWQGKIETRVDVIGSGPPLVYLHGPWGLRADGAFLSGLASSHTVYAPWHPGTTPGDPNAVHEIDDWLDLLVYYGELFDRLGLENPPLAGHSFGGMVACEFAAANPARVPRLVLISPIGLWRDDAPVRNWLIIPEAERRQALFAAPDGEAARAFFAVPEDRDARAEAVAAFTWAQACVGKFVWPIPDKGLKKRIHRVAAQTLILWGDQDHIAAPLYAKDFARHIVGARVEVFADAGHLLHLEQTEPVTRRVREFLDS